MADPITAPYHVTSGSTVEDGWYLTLGLVSLSVDEDAIVLETRKSGVRTWTRDETETVIYGHLRGKFRIFRPGWWSPFGRWFGIELTSGEIPPVAITTMFGQSQLIRALEYRGWPVVRRSWHPT
jgi:hypothetical protein